MPPSYDQPENAQPADSARPKSGKARRLSELSLMARKLAPAEVAQGREIEEVAAEWNAYPAVIERACLVALLRRVDLLEQRNVLAGLRRAA